MAKPKKFLLSKDQIRPLVPGRGGCLASDMVTVDGNAVGYMYREAPDNDLDSGWRFLAGSESQEYLDDPDKLGIYDVNTIANYDPDILPFLNAPPGSAFERDEASGSFRPIVRDDEEPPPIPDAAPPNWPPPGFPLVSGRYALTRNWTVDLPGRFARRVEGRTMVLWRPGLTVHLSAWKNDRGTPRAERAAAIRRAASPDRAAERLSDDGAVVRFSYRLRDRNDDGPVETLQAFVIGDDGHLQMSVSFDDPADEATARAIAESVTHRSEPPPLAR